MPATRILIADDEPNHRRLLSAMLADADPGVRVTTVGDAVAFADALRRGVFDAVILDYHLDESAMAGVLREHAELLENAPIVVVSGSSDQGVAINSFRQGAVDFVPKLEALRRGLLYEKVREAIDEWERSRLERRKRARRESELRRQAETDPLTSLSNRRVADRVLASKRTRQDRRVWCSCLLLDVDHFKLVNDRHGHGAGDGVLRAIADVILASIGPSDVAARWGGEEFLIVRRSCDTVAAWTWADRLRRRISALGLPGPSPGQPLTVSTGVATVATAGLSPQTVTLADHALYLAKAQGRDTVCSWDMVRLERAADNAAQAGGTVSQRRHACVDAMRETLDEQQIADLTVHSERTEEIAADLCECLGLSASATRLARQAAALHDLGKASLPPGLIGAPRKLTAAERGVVREHRARGGHAARRLGADDAVARLVGDTARVCAGAADEPDGAIETEVIAASALLAAIISRRPHRAERPWSDAVRVLQSAHAVAPRVRPQVIVAASRIRVRSGRAKSAA